MIILLIPVFLLMVPIIIGSFIIANIVDYFFGTNWHEKVGDFWF